MKFHLKNSRAAKLTANEVMEIRRLYAETDVTQGQLARDFKVSGVQIGRIIRGEVWQKLGPTPPTKEEIEMVGRRLAELQEKVDAMSPAERIMAAALREREKHPDTMVKELMEGREPTEIEKKAFEMTHCWPPGVKPPQEPLGPRPATDDEIQAVVLGINKKPGVIYPEDI